MAIKYEPIVEEDLSLGHGTVSVSMPAGGSATGHRINLGTFHDRGVAFSTLSAASEVPGQLMVVSDSTTKTPGAAVLGGGSYRILAFSNGTTWLVVMG